MLWVTTQDHLLEIFEDSSIGVPNTMELSSKISSK